MGQLGTKLQVVAGPVTVLKYWNQSPRLLGGTSPLEQKPVQARIMSKLILTNAGSILRSSIRDDTVQNGKVYSQHSNVGVDRSDDIVVPCCIRLQRGELSANKHMSNDVCGYTRDVCTPWEVTSGTLETTEKAGEERVWVGGIT